MNRNFRIVVIFTILLSFVNPSFAGIVANESVQVFSEIGNCQMSCQNDWISADLLIPITLPEEKSLDEITLRTGFFNLLDAPSYSQVSPQSDLRVFVSTDNLKFIENRYFSTNNFCPGLYFDRPVNKLSAEQSAKIYLIKDNKSQNQDILISGNWFYDGSYLTFTSSSPLLPGASYRIVISTELKDLNEKHLSENFYFDFLTMFSSYTSAVIESSGISLILPEYSLPVSGAVFLQPVNSSSIISKTENLTSLGCWQIVFYDDSGNTKDIVLNKSARLNISYSDSNDDGFPETTDGKTTNVLINTLAIYSFSEDKKVWQKIPSDINPAQKTVSAEISHFSKYALFGSGISEVSNVFAYPVPYVPADESGKFSSSGIYFSNLPFPVKITIVDSGGDIVREISPEVPTGEYLWDTRDSQQRLLPSGVYFYIVKKTDTAEIKKGKLLIIR